MCVRAGTLVKLAKNKNNQKPLKRKEETRKQKAKPAGEEGKALKVGKLKPQARLRNPKDSEIPKKN